MHDLEVDINKIPKGITVKFKVVGTNRFIVKLFIARVLLWFVKLILRPCEIEITDLNKESK